MTSSHKWKRDGWATEERLSISDDAWQYNMCVYSISMYFAVCPLSFSLSLSLSSPTPPCLPHITSHISFAHVIQRFTIVSSFSLSHNEWNVLFVCVFWEQAFVTLHGPSFSSPYPKIKKKRNKKSQRQKWNVKHDDMKESRDNVKSGLKLDCFEKVSLKISLRNVMSIVIHSCLWKIE